MREVLVPAPAEPSAEDSEHVFVADLPLVRGPLPQAEVVEVIDEAQLGAPTGRSAGGVARAIGDAIIWVMNLSAAAHDYMVKLGQAYVADGYNRLRKYDTGKRDAVHDELRRHGLIKMHGAPGGSWMIDDAGHDFSVANCEETEG